MPLAAAGPSAYEGVYDVPANTEYAPAFYPVIITARDRLGQEDTAGAGRITQARRPDLAPTINAARVAPVRLIGPGIAHIRANVADDRLVSEVYAMVAGPTGPRTRVEMSEVQPGRYEGAFPAPANSSATPLVYDIVVHAVDSTGHRARADAGQLTVRPSPPGGGVLTVSPATVRFGGVDVGERAVRTVVLSHTGSPSSGELEMDVSVSGPWFRLAGIPANGVKTVLLEPGESVELLVTFAPRRALRKTGQLSVVRQDGLQTGLGVNLIGLGRD